MSSPNQDYLEAVAATEKFYDRFAEYYDEFVPPNEMRSVRVAPLVAFVQKKTDVADRPLRFLELGCGTGSYAIPLAEQHSVVGVDISAGMYQKAKTKLSEVAHSKPAIATNLTYMQADWLSALKQFNQEFDCVLCIGNSLLHNPISSMPLIFSAVHAVLRPNGLFILNGRRVEKELNMVDGPYTGDGEVGRSGGPVSRSIPNTSNVLRYMFMSRVVADDAREEVVTFYTYDNYTENSRRFVCHRLLLDNSERVVLRPINYDCFAVKTYFIFEDCVLRCLKESGFCAVKEESPDPSQFSQRKNWYITAVKPTEC